MEKRNRIRIIAVEPLYQINIGYIARIAKNFGVIDIALVNPRCKILGKNAIKYSKHGLDLLRRAKVFKSLDKAIGNRFAIGTTAMWHKTDMSFYNIYALDRAVEMLRKNSVRDFCIVIGRESTGLSKEELQKCNMSVIIPTPGGYGTLNISHALSILLYEFTKSTTAEPPQGIYAGQKETEALERLFRKMVRAHSNIRDKRGVERAFKNVIGRSNPTRKELNAIAIALSDAHGKKPKDKTGKQA
ncbi:RNA methyltransferase TrmH, group 1 [mine drainage metagenome]|uniref:RNA methyltransferase TrmH, group 1 n=1 Tax=mine drainage metagenome TaxID=410659 RepID=T0ZP32_9ZZZZ